MPKWFVLASRHCSQLYSLIDACNSPDSIRMARCSCGPDEVPRFRVVRILAQVSEERRQVSCKRAFRGLSVILRGETALVSSRQRNPVVLRNGRTRTRLESGWLQYVRGRARSRPFRSLILLRHSSGHHLSARSLQTGGNISRDIRGRGR